MHIKSDKMHIKFEKNKVLKNHKFRRKNITPPLPLVFGNIEATSWDQAGRLIYQFFAFQVNVPAILWIIWIKCSKIQTY